jgi:excisionase family DNA binding protein
MLENLMTVKEVAALLRVSSQTLYKMLEAGTIPAVKIGSQWRFDRDQIRDWLKGQAGATPTTNGASTTSNGTGGG